MGHTMKLEALVFSRRNIGEADRLVTFFTRDRGIVRAVAKGVRRIPSSRGGHLEPMTRVLTLLSESRAGLYVGGIETDEYFKPLRADGVALHHARNMAMVVSGLFDEDQAQPDLYDRLLDAWYSLPQLDMAKRQMLEGAFMMLALKQAGLMPDLQVCQACQEAKPREAVVFAAQDGGWKCLSCHNSLQGTEYSLSPRLLSALRFISAKPEAAVRLKVAEQESTQLLQTVRKCVADLVEQPAFAL